MAAAGATFAAQSTSRSCLSRASPCDQRDLVAIADRRALARHSASLRSLANLLRQVRALVAQRHMASSSQDHAGGCRCVRPNRLGWCSARRDAREGAAKCRRRPQDASSVGKKGDVTDEWLGHSRGGLTSKIHLCVDGHGLPLSFVLTAGQCSEHRRGP